MGQLATATERSEDELVTDVVARVAFNEPERARVEQWVRQALTIAALTAERAEALKEARAVLGLPPVERIDEPLLRADDLPRTICRRLETADPVILDAERILGRDVLLAIPPSLDSYVLVSGAKVTAETEFQPVRSGPRSSRRHPGHAPPTHGRHISGYRDQNRAGGQADLNEEREEANEARPEGDRVRRREYEREVWDPPWATAEIAALEKK
jgi:hypothetical protein